MGRYQDILDRLGAFTKRYYTRQLIKGGLLFLSLGLLFWIGVLSLEYILWLGPGGRLLLFWIFVGVELFLLCRFILMPLLYLFRIRKGMGPKEASLIIGRHFPQVDDKLYNLLELSEHPKKSDLLRASMEQRSQQLGNIPFSRAISLKKGYAYAKYLVLPLLILGFIWISGNLISFFNSHQRLVHYETAYERPAPFSFSLLNEALVVLDDRPLTLSMVVEGSVRPEYVYLVLGGEQLLLQQTDGVYRYTLQPPVPTTTFYFTANGWDSRAYSMGSLPTPALMDFSMELDFPAYLDQTDVVVQGSGNARVPEGTQIKWTLLGKAMEMVALQTGDSISDFEREGDRFFLSRRIFGDLDYELSTSNSHVSDFERLGYSIDVIKDEAPRVKVEQFLDSIHPNVAYYAGQASDDHGLDRVNLVWYPLDDPEAVGQLTLERPKTAVHSFYYSFPSGLELEPGVAYGLYFEVVDNDGLRGGKGTRSQVFTTQLYDDNQLRNKELEIQNETIQQMGNSLETYKEQQEALSKLNREQKEVKNLSFEDQNEIRDFLQRQERQESMMKKFSNELREGLDRNQGDPLMKELLQERLQRQELEAQRNAKLLEELQKVADKLKKDELQERLAQLGKNQGKNLRNLEQILELTKRYYVTEKASQISRELEGLSKVQEELSKEEAGGESERDRQQKLNEEFDGMAKELGELEKDNRDLKKPMDLPDHKSQGESIQKDQKEALEELEKEPTGPKDNQGEGSKGEASKRQKSAAQKMKALSEGLQQGSAAGGASEAEDAQMLRQILDNLLRFSFNQEELFDLTQRSQGDMAQYSRSIREQQDLRRLFQHVDDSLFALSLRRVELSEFVNEQIEEVYYNIDRSLERMAENQMYQGASHQQYVIQATNALADFLASTLERMQENLSAGSGGGGGPEFQLPDIIQGQQNIQQKMGSASEKGKPKEGQEGEQGEGQQKGQQGKEQGKQQTGGQGEEMDPGLIYEIYKEQQVLREQLEFQLQSMIDSLDRKLTEKLLQQMEDFQNDLLQNGVTQRSMAKANAIQHQLLKLEDATLEQGQENRRESTSSQREFTNPITSKPEQLQDYRPGLEILNRQVLPLRQKFEERVKAYFKYD